MELFNSFLLIAYPIFLEVLIINLANAMETSETLQTDSINFEKVSTVTENLIFDDDEFENSLLRPWKPMSSPYFDLTEAITNQRYSEIKNTLNHTSNVLYSTNCLITLPDFEWLATLLEPILSTDSETSPFCLTIVFQMTTNRSAFDWRHIESILDPQIEVQGNITFLKKHLCGIVLDFQLSNLRNDSVNLNYESFEYLRKWDISFTKYAKKFLHKIFNKRTIPVGVLYNEVQLKEKYNYISEILLEQEIKSADFQILNFEFAPLTQMPLMYKQFYNRISLISEINREYLTNRFYSRNDNTSMKIPSMETSYMVTWNHQNYQNFQHELYPYSSVINSTEAEYLKLFQEFTSSTIMNRLFVIAIISGSNFDVETTWLQSKNLYSYGTESSHILPYLYVHDVDTTPCQMKAMLHEISGLFDTLVVNEFTWSTLSRNAAIINDTEAKACSRSLPLKTPKNILLFASKGIGQFWNKTKNAFINLVTNQTKIVEMSLKAIVFSSDDLQIRAEEDHKNYGLPDSHPPATYYGNQTIYKSSADTYQDTGITKFVESWIEANKTGIGCIVDMTDEQFAGAQEIVQITQKKCMPILKSSSVFVWQLTVNCTNYLAYRFSYEFGRLAFKKQMVDLLAARYIMKNLYPEAEIIFQIIGKDHIMTDENRSFYMYKLYRHKFDFDLALMKFARIHQVKVMYKPVFDLKFRDKGIWIPPHT